MFCPGDFTQRLTCIANVFVCLIKLDSLMSHGIELDENTDVVRLFADLSFTPAEKISMFAKSEHDFHR